MKLAWIGTGVMGKQMVLHFIEHGYTVNLYNRTYEKARDLQQDGVVVYQDLATCVKDVDIIFTMVGYPQDVSDVYALIFKHASPHTILVDMTTSSPTLAQSLYQEAKQHQMEMLDAPVSGGDSGAKNATLSIMVGGDKETFDKVKPFLSCLGTNLYYMGTAGNGQHTKACNQIAVAGAVAAMSEAIVYAKHHQLDSAKMLEAIQKGAAGSWQLENTAPRVLKEDFKPGFYMKHFLKDMFIIQAEMDGIALEMLNSVCHMYEVLAKEEGDLGTQALLHYYGQEQNK